jgi:glycosyltransferase involved in cell wall biosynthesis
MRARATARRPPPPRTARGLRVCHVVSTTEGATWMVEQLRELRNRYGFQVAAVVSGSQGGLVDKLRAEAIPHYTADFSFRGARDLPHLPLRILRLAQLLRRERFDVVQTHLFHAMLFGRLAAWLADVPVRLTMLVSPFHLEASTPRWIDRATCWMDTALIPSCERSRLLYRAMGVPEHRLRLVYYAPDATRFDPETVPPANIRGELGWPAATPLIGMVAYFYAVLPANRWTPPSAQGHSVKGHEYLIRAAPLVLREFPTARFVLVGSGWGPRGQDYLDAMRRLVRELGLQDSVVFLGLRSDVPSILRAFDVAVQPSLTDNLGGTLEALLMECPTVATRVGGFADSIRDGETGLLVNPADPQDLANAILQLLRDPVRARALGRAGRQLMLRGYTLAHTVDALAGLYYRLLWRGGTRRRGYRLWVPAARGLMAGAIGAYLALRLLAVDMAILRAWDRLRRRPGYSA